MKLDIIENRVDVNINCEEKIKELAGGDVTYEDLPDKPQISLKTANYNESNNNIELGNKNVTINNIQELLDLGIIDYTILDLSNYGYRNIFNPHDMLPDGRYFVKSGADAYFNSDEVFYIEEGSLIIKKDTELQIIGSLGLLYYSWDEETEEYLGGYPLTPYDLSLVLLDYVKKFKISTSSSLIGSITLNDNYWYIRTKSTGINSITLKFPETIENNYK